MTRRHEEDGLLKFLKDFWRGALVLAVLGLGANSIALVVLAPPIAALGTCIGGAAIWHAPLLTKGLALLLWALAAPPLCWLIYRGMLAFLRWHETDYPQSESYY